MAMCVAPAITYTVPISLTTENIFSIQAIGCDVGKPESNISAATYSIDKTAPASVSSLSIVPNPASHSALLNWTNPIDSDLHAIRVLRKTNNYSIDETDGTIVTDILTNTINDTGLSLGTRYYYSVYAYDNANNFSVVAKASTILFDSSHCADTNNCIIFVTNASYTGTFATPATADGYCNIDSNKPNGSTYKAMIAFPAVRFPCKGANDCTSAVDTTSMSDWVLYPNQNYKRPNNTPIGTTNSSGTFNSLTNAVDPLNPFAWTGLINGWALNAASNFTCLNWTDSSQSGAIGQPNSSNVNTMMYST
ncbi:MAG: DUF1554 domain-containing protein, partial [Leptonema sp. (in: Bacteria)]|nr:DUF1554 domain-containing protein [Leptonema sp. (in: bacteria)]